MILSHALLMAVSLPILVAGWVFALAGVYCLIPALFGFDIGEGNDSLATIWSFAFSFGAVSFSGLIAARARFGEKIYVQKIYSYSIGVSATLFLGYTVLGFLAGLFGLVGW